MMNMLLLFIKLLLNKARLNSRNSSTPPSKDPNRDKTKRDKSTKKLGGQEGHEGTTLSKVANPDVIKDIPVDQSKLPPGKHIIVGLEARQFVDIVISKVVTEYRPEILADEHCKGVQARQFKVGFPVVGTKYALKLVLPAHLCNAHHLRELERTLEQDSQSWGKEMKDLLCSMNKAKTEANGMIPQKDLDALLQCYRDILTKGDIECPAAEKTGKRGRVAQYKSRNLLARLKEFEEETLRFLKSPTVPFTNNQENGTYE